MDEYKLEINASFYTFKAFDSIVTASYKFEQDVNPVKNFKVK